MTNEECRDRFRSFLVKHNLRMTGQRMAIFEAVFKESSHFTAEELLDKARLIDRNRFESDGVSHIANTR